MPAPIPTLTGRSATDGTTLAAAACPPATSLPQMRRSPGAQLRSPRAILDAYSVLCGADPTRTLDLLLVNAPLRDYAERPRVNDFTLPVLGMAYLATYAAERGHNVGVLDAEAHGLGIAQTAALINQLAPRWA